MNSDCIGWDIGGAHLKVARVSVTPSGTFGIGRLAAVVQVPCPLWRGLDELDGAWRCAEASLGAGSRARHAITMTGELADCFTDRAQGVAEIVVAVKRYLHGDFKVYAGADGFLDATGAMRCVKRVASANWHATAACLGKLLGAGMLVDIGSTTTDIVPFTSAGAAVSARCDHERLCAGELVYTGVVRTPVMALADAVQVEGKSRPVVAEMFATTADVYRVLGRLAEEVDQYPACDGADKTLAASAQRLARMFGCDADGAGDWTEYARALAECQMLSIEAAYRKVCNDSCAAGLPLVGTGAGRFLVRDLARRVGETYLDFTDLLDTDRAGDARLAGDCASAVSLAALMRGL